MSGALVTGSPALTRALSLSKGVGLTIAMAGASPAQRRFTDPAAVDATEISSPYCWWVGNTVGGPLRWRRGGILAALVVWGLFGGPVGGAQASQAARLGSMSIGAVREAVGDPARPRARVLGVPDAQWAAMRRAGVARAGCPVGREDLRRVEVDHVGFDGLVHRGVLVVHRDVAVDVAQVFSRLFTAGFPIRSIQPIEVFAGDDNASMAADNTSAYNCRRAGQANAPAADSPHANGRAVDINPRENPWWDPRCACFMPSATSASRTPGPGKILRGGVVWEEFTRRGWTWQDIATADYQHFDTGYPSRPRRR